MGRMFGTDGVRGIANADLSCELAMKIGAAGAYVLTSVHNPRILVGQDTRKSGDMLACALSAGICSIGGDVINVGVIPTPAMAYLARLYSADAAVMISASHNTMEYNGKYMMQNNFEYTKNLMHFAADRKIQMIYASSASTYGSGAHGFTEKPDCEEALNVYAFSKLFFDNYARRYFGKTGSQLVGLRYFNVYGPQENHKGKMASMVFQMYNQWKAEGKVKLFEGIDGYGNGEQTRDFIYVKDVVKVNFFFWDHPELSGVYNCGTGHAHTFNTLAKGVLKHFGSGTLEYIPFPDVLRGKYQSYTQADTTKLLEAGYDGGFTDIDEAVAEYCALLDKTGGYYKYEA